MTGGADAGTLRCLKTAGAHRRFDREEVERYRRQRAGEPVDDQRIGLWIGRLCAQIDIHEVTAELLAERGRLGAWWRVADTMGPVLDEIGARWSRGSLSVLEEHVAAERLSRALARIAESIPTPPDAPRVLLLVAEGDEHTLGLSLAEVCFRELGYRTRWAGRQTPRGDVLGAIERGEAEVCGVSASTYSRPRNLAAQAKVLAAASRAHGVRLVLGGLGPWPPGIPGVIRARTFEELTRPPFAQAAK